MTSSGLESSPPMAVSAVARTIAMAFIVTAPFTPPCGVRQPEGQGPTHPFLGLLLLPLFPCQHAYRAGAREMKKNKIVIPTIGLLVFGFILAKMGWAGIFHQDPKSVV